jgi:hypothetical protein
MNAKDLHPPGERFREFRHKQNVGRSGEEESARHASTIDCDLKGRKKPGNALDFIKDRPLRQIIHKTDRISLGGMREGRIVEGEIGISQRFA